MDFQFPFPYKDKKIAFIKQLSKVKYLNYSQSYSSTNNFKGLNVRQTL